MKGQQNQTIKATNDTGHTIELSTYWDATLVDWVGLFKVILYWLTFDSDVIAELFGEGDEE